MEQTDSGKKGMGRGTVGKKVKGLVKERIKALNDMNKGLGIDNGSVG